MKKIKLLRKIILHISVICTLTLIAAHILDWYNPYMDFLGHLQFIEYTLYAGILTLGATGLLCDNRSSQHTRKPHAIVPKRAAI